MRWTGLRPVARGAWCREPSDAGVRGTVRANVPGERSLPLVKPATPEVPAAHPATPRNRSRLWPAAVPASFAAAATRSPEWWRDAAGNARPAWISGMPQLRKNASRSRLITSAWVVAMPCGYPS